jgi:hypothetical protein
MSLDKVLIFNEKTDTVDTPPPGKIYFTYKDGGLQYKTSAGNVLTIATGVTPEDIQDLMGGLFADSTTLDVTYDDTGNLLTASVIQTALDHTQFLNNGTNTHAQIDSHLASTSNPHATTAVQVGADPVGSSAAAQAFAIQRANHSGTQSASTISNFASAVIATLISGYTVGSNTALAATDTILAALGKLEAQVAAAKQRANHTETQLAATISDFSSAVLATVLAGYTIGSNTALAATDSLLAALGKLEAKANAALERANHTGTQLAATISDFSSSVLATALTGYTVGTDTAIAATDTILAAFGKTQAQITNITSTFASNVLAAVLTGYTSGSNTALAATDSLLTALGKLQAQITADRSTLIERANHTGTQTASTISDFNAATLANLLTGYTVGSNTNLATTDSILAAFGKLQAQITAASATIVFGQGFEVFTDNTAFTSTSTSNVVVATFTTASKEAGTYRIGVRHNLITSNNNNQVTLGIYVDSVLQDREYRYIYSSAVTSDFNICQVVYVSFTGTGSHTIDLRGRITNNSFTVSLVEAEIWRTS